MSGTLLGDARIRIRPDTTGFATEANNSLGSSLKKVAAASAAILATAGLASFVRDTINAGRTYEASLNTLQAVSQATATQMAAVGETAKRLGSDLTLPATSAADAAAVMTELAKASFTVEEAQTAAKGSLQLAAAAQIDAARAATIQASALQAFSLDADQAGRVSDVLANSANASAAEITDVADALSQASAVAAATGISIEDTAATIGILANNGIRGSDAGTLLKSALLALQSPSGPATKAMEELGLSAYDAAGNFVGLSSIFGQLSEAQATMTDEQYAAATSTLFGSDAARLAGIAAREGAEGFDAMAAAMSRTGSAAEVAEAKARGVGGAIEAFKSQVETFQIDLFERAAPEMERVIRYAAENFPDVGNSIIDAFDNGVGYVLGFADTAETAFRAVADYLEPVTSELDDLWSSFTEANGTASVFFDIAKGGAGVLLALFAAAEPVVRVVGSLVGAFADLPAPIQAVVFGLAALKIAASTDLLSRLSGRSGVTGAVAGMGQSFAGFAQSARLNMRLAGDEVGGLSRLTGGLSTAVQQQFPRMTSTVSGSLAGIRASFSQASQAHAHMVGQLTNGGTDRFASSLAGVNAAARNAASQGIGALRSAGGSLVNFMGGPWGIALVAGAAVVGGVTTKINEATKTTEGWTEALIEGGAAARTALEEAQAQADRGNDNWFGRMTRSMDEWLGLQPSVDEARQGVDDYYASLGPLERAQAKAAEWTATYEDRLLRLGPAHEDTIIASRKLAEYQGQVAAAQDRVSTATQTATERLQAMTQAALAGTNADLAASMANTQLTTSISEYAAQMATGTLTALELTAAQDQISQTALSTANAVAQQAYAHSTATDETGKQAAADAALLESLRATAQQLGVNTPQAIRDLIGTLEASASTATTTATSMSNLGLSVLSIPSEREVIITAPTEEQKARLEDLGYTIETLPDGNVRVTADLSPAEQALTDFVNRQRTITLSTTTAGSSSRGASNNATVRQAENLGNRRDGGPIFGPGTSRSDSILGIDRDGVPTSWVSAGEFVTNAAAYRDNRALVEAINAGVVPAGIDPTSLRYLADGGPVYGDTAVRVGLNTAGLTAGVNAALTALNTAGAAGATNIGGTWTALWNVVKAAIPQARTNSTYRRGDPGYHGRNKAVDFGFGTGPGGAGSAGLASIARYLYGTFGSKLAELIYTGVGANVPNIKNGRPHNYSASVNAGHRNHVHAAVYDNGGLLRPGVTEVHNDSGKPEAVLTAEENEMFRELVTTGGKRGDVNLYVTVDPSKSQLPDQMEAAVFELRRLARGGRL